MNGLYIALVWQLWGKCRYNKVANIMPTSGLGAVVGLPKCVCQRQKKKIFIEYLHLSGIGSGCWMFSVQCSLPHKWNFRIFVISPLERRPARPTEPKVIDGALGTHTLGPKSASDQNKSSMGNGTQLACICQILWIFFVYSSNGYY